MLFNENPRGLIDTTSRTHTHINLTFLYRYFTALRDLGLRTVQLLLRALGLPHTHLGPYRTQANGRFR